MFWNQNKLKKDFKNMQKGKYASRCFFLFPISIERMNNWLSNTKRITFLEKNTFEGNSKLFLVCRWIEGCFWNTFSGRLPKKGHNSFLIKCPLYFYFCFCLFLKLFSFLFFTDFFRLNELPPCQNLSSYNPNEKLGFVDICYLSMKLQWKPPLNEITFRLCGPKLL